MDICYFSSPLVLGIIFLAVIIAAGQGDDDHLCAEKKCGSDGPSVRFPFVLKQKQHQNCGFSPQYKLYCDLFNRTLLELPSTRIKFFVTDNSYTSQTMKIQSAEICIWKLLKDLDLSNTPFQVPPDLQVYNVSLFNCTTSTNNPGDFPWNITCVNAPGYTLIPIPTNAYIFTSVDLDFCTKMFDTVANRPVPTFDNNSSTVLSWHLPADCIKCEMHGGICSMENVTGQLRCFGDHYPPGTRGKILRIVGPIIGFLFLALATGAVYHLYSKARVNKDKKIRMKKFLEDYSAMKPTRYSYADIKKMTNDFKDQLGEGSYGNVFKGQVSKDIFVAVKILHDSKRNGEEFINEVQTMGKIHHINVVRLVGFCADGSNKSSGL